MIKIKAIMPRGMDTTLMGLGIHWLRCVFYPFHFFVELREMKSLGVGSDSDQYSGLFTDTTTLSFCIGHCTSPSHPRLLLHMTHCSVLQCFLFLQSVTFTVAAYDLSCCTIISIFYLIKQLLQLKSVQNALKRGLWCWRRLKTTVCTYSSGFWHRNDPL